MNTAQARIGDPVLTNHAHGFKQRRFVGSKLFPAVTVKVRGGKIIEFDKASFVRHSLRRAPGANAREITFGVSGAPYELVQDSCDVKLPIAAFPGCSTGRQYRPVHARGEAGHGVDDAGHGT
jgi:hypothetical protein